MIYQFGSEAELKYYLANHPEILDQAKKIKPKVMILVGREQYDYKQLKELV